MHTPSGAAPRWGCRKAADAHAADACPATPHCWGSRAPRGARAVGGQAVGVRARVVAAIAAAAGALAPVGAPAGGLGRRERGCPARRLGGQGVRPPPVPGIVSAARRGAAPAAAARRGARAAARRRGRTLSTPAGRHATLARFNSLAATSTPGACAFRASPQVHTPHTQAAPPPTTMPGTLQPAHPRAAAQAPATAGGCAGPQRAPARPPRRPAGASCARPAWPPPSARRAGRSGARAGAPRVLRRACHLHGARMA